MMFVAYAAIVAFAGIATFTVCRLVDHFLAIREEKIHAVYTAGLMRTASEEVNWLSTDVIEKMNAQLLAMFKNDEES